MYNLRLAERDWQGPGGRRGAGRIAAGGGAKYWHWQALAVRPGGVGREIRDRAEVGGGVRPAVGFPQRGRPAGRGRPWRVAPFTARPG